MIFQSLESLTATIHVRFHYKEEEQQKPPDGSGLQIINRLLDKAAELQPEMQDLLVRFADHLKNISTDEEGQG